MSGAAWLQLLALLALLAISTRLLGAYMAKVYGGGKAPGDRVFDPLERLIYRVCRVDPATEQRWSTYAISPLAFSLASVVVLYAQLRLQGHLPLNPDHQKSVGTFLSFNTAVSFLTNTNWQNYSGESTMSHFSQMTGLALHNFVSAACGAAVAVALIRGLVRRRTHTLGNFWVDLVRTTVRILLPLAIVFTLVLVTQGAVQNFNQAQTVTTVSGQAQTIPGGPVASQEAIKELGQNGGGLIAAEVGIRARRGSEAAREARADFDRLYRVIDLAARGGDIDDIVSSAQAELIGLFGLVDCTFETSHSETRSADATLPRLGVRGAIEGAALVATHTDFLLPPGGVELPVVGRGHEYGRLVLFASESARASLQKRLVAVAIADELGVTLVTRQVG